MSSEENYIPGVCNIGNEQLAKRKRFLAKCIAITIICVVFIEFFHANKFLRLLMFFPLTLTSVAAQQVLYKFCYRFGLTGLYGFGKVGDDTKIVEGQFRELDRKKSQKMIVSSLLIAAAIAVLYYLI
ncbi:MAG: hypothetical protein ACXVPN_02025 [Bacteroidia bacterium]